MRILIGICSSNLKKAVEHKAALGHKAALVKEQCWLEMRKYSFSQKVIKNGTNCQMIVLMLVV